MNEGVNLQMERKKGNKVVWILLILTVLVIAAAVFFFLGKNKEARVKDSNANLNSVGSLNFGKVTYDNLAFEKEAEATDPLNDVNGPFYHTVYKATSIDGLTFVKTGQIIAEKSSVPDAVNTADGTIFIYAVDGARRSKNGLMVMVSKDRGETWKQGALGLTINDPDYPSTADPQAVLLSDGKIRLYFIAFPAKKPPLDANGAPIPTGELNKIKSAISSDGFNFVLEDGVRYATTETLTDPDVVKIGSQWFMYLSKGTENIAFSSNDGLTFKLEKTIRTDGAISKTVNIGDGKFRQFFCKSGISSATTTDGLTFSNDSGIRLAAGSGEIICDPSPVKVGNEWLLFYKVAPVPTKK